MKKRWLLVVLGVAAFWLTLAGVSIALGVHQASTSRESLDRLQLAATPEGYDSGAVDREIRTTGEQLERVHFFLSNPVVRPLHLFPWVGRQLRSASALSAAGAEVSTLGLDVITKARDLETASKMDRAASLQQLGDVATQAADKLENIDLGPNKNLVAPLADARTEAATRLDDTHATLRRSAGAAHAVSGLLRSNGTYLVLAANNAEMRSGSGMFLSAGALHTAGGALDLQDMRSVGTIDVPDGSVVWPAELQGLWGWLGKHEDMRNLMASPRFDVAAPLAADVWEKSGGGHVDGVLVIDVEMLRAMVAAVGSVEVDGKKISAAGVLKEVLLEQYSQLEIPGGTNSGRREVLSDLARNVFVKLDEGTWEPTVLGRELGNAADGRHVMAWSRDPKMNEYWSAAGVSGTVGPNSMMVDLVNLGGNKLDQFVNVAVRWDVPSASGQPREEVLTVELENFAPSLLPAYVAGPFPGSGLQKGEYRGFLSFSLPGDVTDAHFDGGRIARVNGRDGDTWAIATAVSMKRGEKQSVTLRFLRPPASRTTEVLSSARIPSVEWTTGARQWKDAKKLVVTH